MGKKRSKRGSMCSDQSSILNETSSSESSFLQNHSTVGNHEISGHLKVQLCCNSENKEEYNKWTKNCYWRNIAFVRRSILDAYHCRSLVLIQGASNNAIFVAHPLKLVKNGTIALLDSMGFHNDEQVTIHPLEEVCEARTIIFNTQSSLPGNLLHDMLVNKLSNRYIWCGLNLQFSLFGLQSDCVISEILPKEKSIDLNTSSVKKNISSLFSKLSLQDSLQPESPVSPNTFDCFTTNYSSLVVSSDHAAQGLPDSHFPLFSDLIGCKQQIEAIRNYIDKFLKSTSDPVRNSCRLLLLSGPLKSAKNMTVNAICNEYSTVDAKRVNMSSLNCKNSAAALEELKFNIKKNNKSSPSFLILDKLDHFCLFKTKDHISNLFRQLNEICGVLVIATLCSELILNEQLLGSFSVQEVKFTPPSASERETIIQSILSKEKKELVPGKIKYFAEMLQGLSSGDIFRIFKFDAYLLSLIRCKNAPTSQCGLSSCDIETAIRNRKSLSSDLKANKVRWSDIGGMESVKKELMEELELLTQTPKEKLERFNYTPSQGILLYGPPGCCKTMIAKAIATECNWNFISKKASELMNMYVGESEKAVANLFLEARLKSPCIIFLDEIDTIAPSRNRSASASGVQNRVVNCLLTEMAGIETLKDVLIIAATNRPDIIDDALLRRGRIGKLIYVPLPDPKTRRELLRLSMKKRSFSENIDFDRLVESTEGYTGAEIVQVCNEAAMQLLMEDFESSPVIRKEHFERALLSVRPLTHADTILFYEQFHSRNSKGTS